MKHPTHPHPVSTTTSTEPSDNPAGDELARMSAEIAHLQSALTAAEGELLELRERRSLEMARLERQVYWLERWSIDLDAWMRRRPVRIALRTLGFVLRLPRRLNDRRR